LTFTDEQRIACEQNVQCLFDLAITGDMQFAENTLNHEKDANRTQEDLGITTMDKNSTFSIRLVACDLLL
jgi:hypothetical protein